MFRHIYYYRLLSGIRDREMVFWTMLFPIILATFFNLAFSNLDEGDSFKSIPIAVIDNDRYNQDTMFRQVLDSVSSGEDALFSLQVMSLKSAEQALSEDAIIGFIEPDEKLNVSIGYSGMQQTIIKVFADEYMQTEATIKRLMSENPQFKPLDLFTKTASYLTDKPASPVFPKSSLTYYYALIAMTCLYGGFWGLREVIAVKANLSAQAARVNLSPTPKLLQFSSALLAALTVHFATILLLLLYLSQVLGVNFGSRIWLILLASLVGSTLGITIGALIGTLNNKSENVKTAILIGFSMLMTFFAGLMVADMKYIMASKSPLFRWLNPANLISDAFYALYYYETTTRYWQNIGAMIALQLLGTVVIFIVMRRQKYASI